MSEQRSLQLEELSFDNRFVSCLPADKQQGSKARQVYGALYSRVEPTPVSRPKTIICSPEVLDLLELDREVCHSKEFAEVFSGNRLLPGMEPHASVYGGHQFGNWAGQLGDGRAISLGEVLTSSGAHWTLQLKGAGSTPYSRGADGRAVLRSSIREFLCSEAMHHLGVPTTRALSLVLSGDQVVRDMFYDGNPAAEPGAIVCRVAPTFTRFGHFQLLAARGETDLLRRLLDFTIAADFPALLKPPLAGPADTVDSTQDKAQTYLSWFEDVCRRTVNMIVHWQRVGFVHGVMNTDNMSVLGLTIDYGPYGWIDNYDPDWTPNTTDAGQRRYRFGQQPAIAQWNLYQLANAILPLIGDAAALEDILERFPAWYQAAWGEMMAAKLGIGAFDETRDAPLFNELDKLLRRQETDMTLFFRKLSGFDPDDDTCRLIDVVREAFYEPNDALPADEPFAQWEQAYRSRLLNFRAEVPEAFWTEARQRMNEVNPCYVLRNYLAQSAIDEAEQGDYAMLEELLQVMRRPYEEQPGCEHLAAKRPDWARERAGSSMLSCSS